MPSPALNYNRIGSFALQEHLVKVASGKGLAPKNDVIGLRGSVGAGTPL